MVKTSFGPNGMNKMIINHLDKLFVTNDAATMIRELEVTPTLTLTLTLTPTLALALALIGLSHCLPSPSPSPCTSLYNSPCVLWVMTGSWYRH